MNAKEFFQLENAFDRAEAQLPWIADMAVAQAAASPADQAAVTPAGQALDRSPVHSSDPLAVSMVSVTLDETDGLQNALTSPGTPEDANDNDIAPTSLPGEFSARLAMLWGGTAPTPIGAALGGYDGTNSGLDILSISAGPLANVTTAFTDGTGNALDGDASGLKTTDGVEIFLWTDSQDPNIVLGRQGTWVTDHYEADLGGDIVFAGYLQQSTDPITSQVVGAKMWTMQYESLYNPDATNHDDPIDLTDHLWVSINQARSFSLAGIPSGQNLFLMVGDSEAAVVITGLKPANTSEGVKMVLGDTVNTSQAGNGAIGTNNQWIDPPAGAKPGEGMYFTFVSGADTNYVAPNLDETEADSEANIVFSDLYAHSSASFRISKVSTSNSATLKITALNTDLETGNGFVDGLGDSDDTKVNITEVTVYTLVNGEYVEVTDPNLQIIDNGDGTFKVQGVRTEYVVSYETAAPHTRLMVENVGSNNPMYNASFDIGGFAFNESQSTTEEIGSKVRFEDDGPTMDANLLPAPTLTVDDSNFALNASASFATLFDSAFNNDGFKDTDHNGEQDDDALVYTLGVSAPGVDSGLVDTLSGDAVLLNLVGDVVIGSVGTNEVFRISVNPQTGEVTLDQSRAVWHDDPTDPEESGDSAAKLASADLVTLKATITDGDLDKDIAVRDIGDAFRFKDDGPTIDTNMVAVPTLTVDDSNFTDNASASFATLFDSAFKNDGFKDSDDNDLQDSDAITYALGVISPNVNSGLVDTLSGDAVLLNLVGDVVIGSVGTNEVFRISVNAQTGEVTLDQSRAVWHDDPTDPEESGDSAAKLASADLVTLKATITDGDLDKDIAVRDIGDAFRFTDDGPTFSSITNLVGFNVAAPLVGYYAATPGNDGDDILLNTLSGMVDGNAIKNTQLTAAGEMNGEVKYTFSFDYLPGPASTEWLMASGSVYFNQKDGTYQFELDAPIGGETTYSTSSAFKTFNYDLVGNKSPEIVVQQYTEAADFFGVLTAKAAEPPSDTSDLVAVGKDDPYIFSAGEVFTSQAVAYLNIATSTVGANSDTMQAGELLNFDFYAENPVDGVQSPPQNPSASIDPTALKAYASQIEIVLDQINVGQEDLAILLKLHPKAGGEETTKLLIANAAADYQADPDGTGYYIVTVGKDDYDSATYEIGGVQIMSSTENVTGTGYSLSSHGVTAVNLTADGKGLADTSDTDVFKIIKIDVTTEQTSNFDTDLQFEGKIVDGDDDSAAFGFTVHLEANSNILAAPGSSAALNGTAGADIFMVAAGSSSLELAKALYVTGDASGFQSGSDTLKLGLAGDATAGTGNYVEAGSPVADYDAALLAANSALAALHGTSAAGQLYAFAYTASNGYLFEDTNSDGSADQVVVLVGIDGSEFEAKDIVA